MTLVTRRTRRAAARADGRRGPRAGEGDL